MSLNITKKSRKRAGLELVVAGGVLLFSKFLLVTLAPIMISVFGLYRGFLKKRPAEGTFYVVVGIGLWLALRVTSLRLLLWIPTMLGLIILIYGLVLLFKKSKNG